MVQTELKTELNSNHNLSSILSLCSLKLVVKPFVQQRVLISSNICKTNFKIRILTANATFYYQRLGGKFLMSVGVPTTMRKQQHFCTLSTHKKREAQIVLYSFSFWHYDHFTGGKANRPEENFYVSICTYRGTTVCRPTEHTEAHLFWEKNLAIEITRRKKHQGSTEKL